MASTEQYLGNPNLKKANVFQKFTKKLIGEVLRCSEDPVYFIRNYIKIVSLDKGLIPFDMYHFQEEMVSKFHDFDNSQTISLRKRVFRSSTKPKKTLE